MQIISINIGKEQVLERDRRAHTTGIYKQPIQSPVMVYKLGLSGDTICDTKNHGGVDQAVYIYGEPDYAWWSKELGRELVPGTFGENLTIQGLESARFSIGDRLMMNEVVLEVTAPRIPCGTLAARMGDPMFVKRFRFAERPGLYCRVIAEGSVHAGEAVNWLRFNGDTITIIEMMRDFYQPDLSEAQIRRHLAAPIAIRDRLEREKQLGK